ncbi:hypothetical protein WS68_04745 [Burkholderia sp. TSV86]|nr:hypothetical protein WS68_04745 [Burkholderia sp. TSV86]
MNETRSQFIDLDAAHAWRLGLPYRQRRNVLTYGAQRVPPGGVNFEVLTQAGGLLDAAQPRTYAGQQLTVYTEAQAGLTALVDHIETAEFDAPALDAFDGVLTESARDAQLINAGYRLADRLLPPNHEAEPQVWIAPRGYTEYRNASGFYRPKRQRTSLLTGFVRYEYDEYTCVLTKTTDTVGNQTTASHDYRFLMPEHIVDLNANVHEVLFDALGRVTATRAYTYDRGGNLTRIQHRGAVNYTQEIVVSDRSNHALQQNATGTLTPAGVDDGSWFDASGNQRMLLPDRLQPLNWNDRNRLSGVTLVPRPSQPDRETYQYGADGMRVRKQATLRTSGTIRTSEVIYLPGLTLRITMNDDGQAVKVVAALQEVKVDASRLSARTLHWETGQPPGIANGTTRYGIGDLINSIGLELDELANLISREEYYPYGGTAVWTACSQVEADMKYVRYSGKERDATGLYDYGWRAYQPWIGRWLNPDPAGTVDGLNLYRMVMNNPTKLVDAAGLAPTTKDELLKQYRDSYDPHDRNLPFEIMERVTGGLIKFEQDMANENILNAAKDIKFTIRHYTKFEPGASKFDEIASNFHLTAKNIKEDNSRASGSNTNRDDWERLGNTFFTFFLLSIKGEVPKRGFLSDRTHYAEIDVENIEELESLGLENVDFFASQDLIAVKDLSKASAVKGKLSDLKSIILKKLNLPPLFIKKMGGKEILQALDEKFKGPLEIKIPGNVKANHWFENKNKLTV